jgi:hypothetical protein
MFDLKPLHREAVPKALEKAERYRLLNEPSEAVSICEDVLRLDPDNQAAAVTLLLALTDLFAEFGESPARAQALLPRLRGEYERLYYAGIVAERLAKAHLKRGGPGSGFTAHHGLREAMTFYEKAEAIRPAGNDDALLRWNACARLLMENPALRPAPEDRSEPPLE